MAEGGMEFENQEYYRDDIDKGEVGTPFVDEEEFYRKLTNQYEAMVDLTGNTLEENKNNVVKMIVKRFNKNSQEHLRFDEDEVVWQIAKDKYGRLMLI